MPKSFTSSTPGLIKKTIFSRKMPLKYKILPKLFKMPICLLALYNKDVRRKALQPEQSAINTIAELPYR
jgi:hypothetical protein